MPRLLRGQSHRGRPGLHAGATAGPPPPQEFRQDLGIELEPKQPLYRLFHGHCGPDYAGYSFRGKEFRLVVTVRHPLLSILSNLRRDPKVLDDFLFAVEFVFRLDAFFFCTDLWQNDQPRLLGVFSHFGLTPGVPTLSTSGSGR